MTSQEFRTIVQLAEECFYHNLDGRWKCLERFEMLMDWLEVEQDWREPIRVMTEGNGYYGAEAWIKG